MAANFRGRKDTFGDGVHDWIGVRYAVGPAGPTMELPIAYLEQTLEALVPLCAHKGSLPIKVVQSAIGKAARV